MKEIKNVGINKSYHMCIDIENKSTIESRVIMGNRFLSRGKRFDNGEWIKGYYLKGIMEDWHLICPKQTMSSYANKTDTAEGFLAGQFYLAIPETIGQCTGRMDYKNDKLIYQDDIIKTHGGADIGLVWIIKYHEELKSLLAFCPYLGGWEYVFDLSGIEVIGNIHDNPGLIKRRKK